MDKQNCLGCGVVFQPLVGWQMYCTRACQRAKGGYAFVCGVCSVEFRSVAKDRKYCSKRCADIAYVRSPNRIAVRKYPKIEGLTDQQVRYFMNPASRGYRTRKRRELVMRLGGKCVMCGYSNILALVLDHKDGKGHLERKSKGDAQALNYYIKNFEAAQEKLQVLCANCNQIKAILCKEGAQSTRLENRFPDLWAKHAVEYLTDAPN